MELETVLLQIGGVAVVVVTVTVCLWCACRKDDDLYRRHINDHCIIEPREDRGDIVSIIERLDLNDPRSISRTISVVPQTPCVLEEDTDDEEDLFTSQTEHREPPIHLVEEGGSPSKAQARKDVPFTYRGQSDDEKIQRIQCTYAEDYEISKCPVSEPLISQGDEAESTSSISPSDSWVTCAINSPPVTYPGTMHVSLAYDCQSDDEGVPRLNYSSADVPETGAPSKCPVRQSLTRPREEARPTDSFALEPDESRMISAIHTPTPATTSYICMNGPTRRKCNTFCGAPSVPYYLSDVSEMETSKCSAREPLTSRCEEAESTNSIEPSDARVNCKINIPPATTSYISMDGTTRGKCNTFCGAPPLPYYLSDNDCGENPLKTPSASESSFRFNTRPNSLGLLDSKRSRPLSDEVPPPESEVDHIVGSDCSDIGSYQDMRQLAKCLGRHTSSQESVSKSAKCLGRHTSSQESVSKSAKCLGRHTSSQESVSKSAKCLGRHTSSQESVSKSAKCLGRHTSSQESVSKSAKCLGRLTSSQESISMSDNERLSLYVVAPSSRPSSFTPSSRPSSFTPSSRPSSFTSSIHV